MRVIIYGLTMVFSKAGSRIFLLVQRSEAIPDDRLHRILCL